jgi:hypothetical protein
VRSGKQEVRGGRRNNAEFNAKAQEKPGGSGCGVVMIPDSWNTIPEIWNRFQISEKKREGGRTPASPSLYLFWSWRWDLNLKSESLAVFSA